MNRNCNSANNGNDLIRLFALCASPLLLAASIVACNSRPPLPDPTIPPPVAAPGTWLVKFDDGEAAVGIASIEAVDGLDLLSTANDPLTKLGIRTVTADSAASAAELIGVESVAEGWPERVIEGAYSLPPGEDVKPAPSMTITLDANVALPTDPLALTSQWQNAKIQAAGAWEVGATGQGITVAIVDTGIDCTHPDLSNNCVSGYNAITRQPGFPGDGHGHGTWCAGAAAAVANGLQGVGVAFGAKVMPIIVLNAQGSGSTDVISAGIVWAVDHGAKVISMSLGGPQGSPTMQDAVRYAVQRGVAVIAAAGNSPVTTKGYPGGYDEVIAVAATDQSDNRTSFSTYGSWVDVAAPGLNTVATTRGGGYGSSSGTSMSTPQVAGMAALFLALGVPQPALMALMQSTGDRIGQLGIAPNGGRINVRKAVASLGPVPTATVPVRPTDPPTFAPPTLPIPDPTSPNPEPTPVLGPVSCLYLDYGRGIFRSIPCPE